jgi:hypothetical protein
MYRQTHRHLKTWKIVIQMFKKGGQTNRHVERWTTIQTEVHKSVQINE